MQDIIINRLRVLVNHMPFMNTKNQAHAISKANGMIDEYFANGGEFIETDLSAWLKPRCDKCKNWNDKSILANFCYNCGRALIR